MRTNSTFVQDGYIIKGAQEGMSVSSLLSNFGSGISLKKDGTTLANNENIPNGAVISNGGASYAVLVKGDVYGDGIIDTLDYISVKRACMNNMVLEGMDLMAADIGDDGLDVFDYLFIKRHCMGTYDIYK
jgi:hypothetical protein